MLLKDVYRLGLKAEATNKRVGEVERKENDHHRAVTKDASEFRKASSGELTDKFQQLQQQIESRHRQVQADLAALAAGLKSELGDSLSTGLEYAARQGEIKMEKHVEQVVNVATAALTALAEQKELECKARLNIEGCVDFAKGSNLAYNGQGVYSRFTSWLRDNDSIIKRQLHELEQQNYDLRQKIGKVDHLELAVQEGLGTLKRHEPSIEASADQLDGLKSRVLRMEYATTETKSSLVSQVKQLQSESINHREES